MSIKVGDKIIGINAVIEVGMASVNQKKTIVNVIPKTILEL